MDFLDKLNYLMERDKYNKNSLSKASGIPYTTINGWYKRGYDELRLPTVKRLCSFFNTSLDFWLKEDVTDPDYGKTNGFEISFDEMNHVEKYRTLDDQGKESVDYTLDKESKRVEALAAKDARIAELEAVRAKKEQSVTSIIEFQPKKRVRAYLDMGKIACAGTGFYFEDIPSEVIEAPYMPGADFVVGVNGDSMEPDFHDGEKVYVQKVPDLALGDVGIFTVWGECFIKEYGSQGLLSRNPDYADIPGTEDVRLVGRVLGKVGKG